MGKLQPQTLDFVISSLLFREIACSCFMELSKRDKMGGCAKHFMVVVFSNKFNNKFNNTRAQMLDSIDQMTLKLV